LHDILLLGDSLSLAHSEGDQMDIVGDKEKIELENRNEDPMNFAPSPSVDWRFGGLVPTGNPMAITKGSTSMVVESFGPTLWDQSQTTNSQNLGGLFCDINNNVQNSNWIFSSVIGY
ncbi:transcription factor bHLH49, partial [Fagus crenata]